MNRVDIRSEHILLVNPWIHDFAAYDFWLQPYGLLSLAAQLLSRGFQVSYVDALDPFHPGEADFPRRRRFGTGKFRRTRVSRPAVLADVPRAYCRYGVSEEVLSADLKELPRPRLIFVTALMTYWYPGAQAAISLLKRIFPDVPVVLGGAYPTLCPDHARRESGADLIVSRGDLTRLAVLAQEVFPDGPEFPRQAEPLTFSPAWDLLRRVPYVCLLTSVGCPFKCSYCASHLLQPQFNRRDIAVVESEIVKWAARGVMDFAFYDDALLYQADEHLAPLLEAICRRGLKVRFHCPNGLHWRYLDAPLARLLRRAGFQTLRFGLETVNPDRQRATGGKVDEQILHRGVRALKQAGFELSQVGCYLLAGLPGQHWREVAEGIKLTKSQGLTPYLAEYSPIPGTPLWEEALQQSAYDIANEPLWHNNSLLACRWSEFTWDDLQRLKAMARD